MQMPWRSPSATKCLEELPRWKTDLDSNHFGSKILGARFILAQFVTDSHLIQEASGVCLLCQCAPALVWNLKG